MPTERVNILFYSAILVVLICAVGLLFWLQNQFEQERVEEIENIHSLLDLELIKSPENPVIDFYNLERQVSNREQTSLINHLVITKLYNGVDRVIYPWDYSVLYPEWQKRLAAFEHLKVKSSGQRIGDLYIMPEGAHITQIRMAISGLAVLIVMTLVVIASRLWKKEKELTETTIELTEKRNEMIRLERLALAGQLTANIFHDIRKPVLNIKHELVDLNETLRDLAGANIPLKNIRDQVQLFLEILRELNLEKFVRSDSSDPEFVNLNEILDRSLQLVRYEQKNVEVNKDYEGELPLVFALPYRLIQVFSNIILNAYQAMNGTGKLQLTTCWAGSRVEVRITDSGPGMTAEIRETVFEPFYTTKQSREGSGLGLYICREIVQGMGGEIQLESSAGEGTMFVVRLPERNSETNDS